MTDSQYEEYRKTCFMRTFQKQLETIPYPERHGAAVIYWQQFLHEVDRVLAPVDLNE